MNKSRMASRGQRGKMQNAGPQNVSCATLARELDVSETTVHEMVRRACCRNR